MSNNLANNQSDNLGQLNQQLVDAGYHAINPTSHIAKLLNNPREIDSYLEVQCLLDCLHEDNEDGNTFRHDDIHGALLCLTDGVLQIGNDNQARRLIRMLFQLCIIDSEIQHRRQYFDELIKRQDNSEQTIESLA